MNILRNLDTIDFRLLWAGRLNLHDICVDRIRRLARVGLITVPAFCKLREDSDATGGEWGLYKSVLRDIGVSNGILAPQPRVVRQPAPPSPAREPTLRVGTPSKRLLALAAPRKRLHPAMDRLAGPNEHNLPMSPIRNRPASSGPVPAVFARLSVPRPASSPRVEDDVGAVATPVGNARAAVISARQQQLAMERLSSVPRTSSPPASPPPACIGAWGGSTSTSSRRLKHPAPVLAADVSSGQPESAAQAPATTRPHTAAEQVSRASKRRARRAAKRAAKLAAKEAAASQAAATTVATLGPSASEPAPHEPTACEDAHATPVVAAHSPPRSPSLVGERPSSERVTTTPPAATAAMRRPRQHSVSCDRSAQRGVQGLGGGRLATSMSASSLPAPDAGPAAGARLPAPAWTATQPAKPLRMVSTPLHGVTTPHMGDASLAHHGRPFGARAVVAGARAQPSQHSHQHPHRRHVRGASATSIDAGRHHGASRSRHRGNAPSLITPTVVHIGLEPLVTPLRAKPQRAVLAASTVSIVGGFEGGALCAARQPHKSPGHRRSASLHRPASHGVAQVVRVGYEATRHRAHVGPRSFVAARRAQASCRSYAPAALRSRRERSNRAVVSTPQYQIW